jgi:hypothetical protein
MTKWPKVLMFSMVGAVGTVLNTVLLLAVLFRVSPTTSAGASVQNDPSAQAAARAELCLWESKPGSFDSQPSASDLVTQIHCTREDAEALLRNAAEDEQAHRFRCSPTGAVE